MVGCGQYPNPNDLSSVPADRRVEIANRRLEAAESTLQYKVETKEIDDDRRNALIRELADDMLTKLDPEVIPDKNQWMYASLLRVTNRWKEAEVALKKAVQAAKTSDRRVNDTLKLAQAQAKNNEVAEALVSANSVMNATDIESAPILPAVLYEVVPAAEGKGHDRELAELLEKAIECHRRVKINPSTDEGKAFLIARSHHIGLAQTKIAELSARRG